MEPHNGQPIGPDAEDPGEGPTDKLGETDGEGTGEPTLVELEEEFASSLEQNAPNQIAEAATTLADEYVSLSQASRALEVLDLAIDKIDSTQAVEAVAELNAQYGTILHYGMSRPEAAEHFEDAVAGFAAAGNRKRQADMTYNLGNTLTAAGRFIEAADQFRDAADRFTSLGLQLDASDCLVAQALATHATGDPSAADEVLTRARALADKTGDPLRVPHFLTALTPGLEWSQSPETASWAFSQARQIVKQHSGTEGQEMLLSVLRRWMRWSARSGAPETAVAVSRELMRAAESEDVREHQANASADAASVLVDLGELDLAQAALQNAESLMAPDDVLTPPLVQLAWGLIHMQRGLTAEAEQNFQSARSGFTELGDSESRAITAGILGVLRQREERFAEARELFIEQRDNANTPLSRGMGLHNLALTNTMLGEPSRSLLQEAHQLLGFDTYLGVLAATNLALSLVLEEPKDLAAAQRLTRLVEDRINTLPTAQQPQLLFQLGNTVQEWDQLRGEELFARAESLAQDTGVIFIAAAATAARAQRYLDEERWDEALPLLRQEQALHTEMGTGLHRVETDNHVAWVLSLKSDASESDSDSRDARVEARDLAVTSYLGFEARRRGVTNQAGRLNSDDANSYWEAAFVLAAEADDLDTVADLIEFRNSLGPVAQDKVTGEPPWARHGRFPAALLSPAEPLVVPTDDLTDDDAVVATHLAAGLGNTVAASDDFPLELPPLIRRPDGSVCLGRYAELAQQRYGISVFSDQELQIGSKQREDI